MFSHWSLSFRAFAVLFGLGLLGPANGGSASAAEEMATFELVIDITWSAETAPLEFPEQPHMSGLIGATHNSRYVLFRDGHTASSGLELVAENGRVKTLRAEFAEALRRGRLGTMIDGPNLEQAPGRISTTFTATKTHPLLSFVTMIAPSPDWFTGSADIALTAEDTWIEEAEIVLWAWDSGTDGGQTYEAPDDDMQPRQSIRLLASPHFLRTRGLVAVGTATLRRLQP